MTASATRWRVNSEHEVASRARSSASRAPTGLASACKSERSGDPACPGRRLRSGVNCREIHLGQGDVVEIIRQGLRSHVSDHFNNSGVVDTGCACGLYLLAAQVTTTFGDLSGKRSESIELAMASAEDVFPGKPGLAGKQRVSRQAIVAAVDL